MLPFTIRWTLRNWEFAVTSPRYELIETTAGQVAAELVRRGISADERVTIAIDPAQELIPGRRESRARVIAGGVSDEDIDRLIDEARAEVQPLLG